MKIFKQTKKALLLSVFMLVVCLSMLIGTTYAWFTDSASSGGNVIQAGNLDVKMEWADGSVAPDAATWIDVEAKDADPIFENTKWEPGYAEARYIKIKNEGNLAFKWKLFISPNGEYSELAEVIDVYFIEEAKLITREDLKTPICTLLELIEDEDGAAYGALLPEGKTATNEYERVEEVVVTVVFKMREDAGNEYAGKKIGANFDIKLVATQYNYEKDSFGPDYDKDAEYPTMVDTWDGTTDISWFLENSTATEYTLDSAEDLAGLAALIDGTAPIPADSEITLPGTFEGVTFKLGADVDLYIEGANGEAICFNPIGSYRQELPFRGTFDGQGHTIKNLNQNTWELNTGYYYGDLGLGLFSCIEDATIKNLIIDGASISGESALCGTIAATAYGDCVFENITIKNAKVADYQYYAGGIVGWASGNHQYINCNIDASTTIATQWGDFDNSTGGVIGGASGSAEILIKDTTVACRLDVVNDVVSSYQWYSYRRAGMLIGNTGKTTTESGSTVAAAPQLTCENVTVIYGEWANYHYCEFAGTSWPYVRVEAGVSVSAYSNVRYGHPTDANGNTVVDDNHVHNEGEDHFILLEFDQLYGGGQGVYGTATHEGVTVIYNNK